MSTAAGSAAQPVHGGNATGWLSRIFAGNPAGLNWSRAVLILDVMLLPLILFWSIGHEEYILSAVLGVVFTSMADPGGSYGTRVSRLAVFGLIGAALTALGYGIGGDLWVWLMLATFAVTLLAGLAITFGLHAVAAANMLNFQFLIALSVAFNEHHTHHTSYTWAQVLAWTGGATLWIALTFLAWLIRGRKGGRALFAEIPADTSRIPLTRPIVLFMVIRAVAIAAVVAFAFGLQVPHGQWMVFAALLAMKSNLEESGLVGAQRLAGAVIGAAVAGLLMLIPANETGHNLVSITHGLTLVAIVFLMHAIGVRFWNFAFYTAAVAGAVLILLDLRQPTNFSAEGYRVLWTLVGVAIGMLFVFIAGLIVKATTPAPPQPASQPA